MSEIDGGMTAWTDAVCSELGLDALTTQDLTTPDAILDLARDVAHGVARPAAPLTTFLVGRAVEAGLPLAEAVARISRLAQSWPPPADAP